MGNFKKDLEKGHKAEQFVLLQLKKEFPTLKQIKGAFKDYDLESDGYSFEVKFDQLSEKTKRVGIEFKCSQKNSGIKTTKSSEWIHIYKLYDNWVYSRIKTGDLKAYLRNNNEYLDKSSGGDNNSSEMVLISVYDFADAFGYEPIL